MITVGVELAERRYEVCIGSPDPDELGQQLAAALEGATGLAVLVDGGVARLSPRVAPLCESLRARFPDVQRLDLPAGETAKTLVQIERTVEWLADRRFDRAAAVLGIGGGATGDHAGFAAAIYLRGVRSVLCPTTLLAMVDASIGGKTGVDLAAGKNLVGAFHQPRLVVADLGFLSTLPARERRAGLAEVVKCGCVADPALLDLLERDADRLRTDPPPAAYQELVERSVRVKAAVVAEDEREGGRRMILNFGHTLGHALEADSAYALLHGEAIALGMVAALRLGVRRGITEPALAARVQNLLERLGLPVDLDGRVTGAVLARASVDKKRRAGAIRFVLCRAAGQPLVAEVAPETLAAELYEGSR